jgi:PhnB protein
MNDAKGSSGNVWWIATHIADLTPQEQAKPYEEMEIKWTKK